MRQTKVSASLGFLFLSMALVASTDFTQALDAQAPAAGTTVAVKMLDAVNSGSDPAGKQYRASVTKAVTAANGIAIAQGSAAIVTLTNGGSGYTSQLVSVTINGQPVAVTSGPASVLAAAQTAGNAAGAVNSVLGRFGRRVSTPAPDAVVAIATGRSVLLPAGTTLSFRLSQSPMAAQSASAGQTTTQTTTQTTIASSAPLPNSASGSAPVATQGQHWWMCRYYDPKDVNQRALGMRVYYSAFPDSPSSSVALGEVGSGAYSTAMVKHFIAYVRQTYKVTDLAGNPTGQYNGYAGGYCRRISDDAAGRTNTIAGMLKGFPPDHLEGIEVNFADTPAQVANGDAAGAAVAAAAAPRPTAASTSGRFIVCSTSGGPGMDTYLTGVIQTTRVKYTPSGGNLVDQSILDGFYAYLTQHGYKFKPGSNYGCAVQPTEAEAKADEQKRQSGCSNCGKIVETGWKG